MSGFNKKEKTETLLQKLRSITEKSFRKNNLEQCMSAMSACAFIEYEYNQFYIDDILEDYVTKLSIKFKERYGTSYTPNKNTILFYDGFGLDMRGVAFLYLKALHLKNYHIVYVTRSEAAGAIPHLEEILKSSGADILYVDMKTNYTSWCIELINVFNEYKPSAAFFYTTPFDVPGNVAFACFQGACKRYLIDLTDHAFWLGRSANDYFLGSREMSASNQYFYRGIEKERCIKLGVNLNVEEVNEHDPLPFDVERSKYIFSGGALYKTLGDPENTYYNMVRSILNRTEKVNFLYAGQGDDSEMIKLINEFPNRVYLIDERKDFYYLIQNCTVYLNTYPMFGGMMMKYAGHAHRIPLTLKHGNDADGLLLNQSKLKIEYDNAEDLVDDAVKLLKDDDYRREREKLLIGSTISEERFANNVDGVIKNQKTDYEHDFIKQDTSKFRQEFFERFNYDEACMSIFNGLNKSLALDLYPLFIKYIPVKFLNKVREKIGND